MTQAQIAQLTPAQKGRLQGFRAHCRVRGRVAVTDTDETVTIVVDDEQPFADPTQEAKGKSVVFAKVSIELGVVEDPRAITLFRETKPGGRNYAVLTYDESAADGVTWKFTCEAQRLNVTEGEGDVE